MSSKVPTKEGYLTKQGIVVKNWKKRWFVMEGTLLAYFKKPKDVFPAGYIVFKDATGSSSIFTKETSFSSSSFVFFFNNEASSN